MYELPSQTVAIAASRPLPIPIPKNTQYSLSHIAFDPPQHSPPSLWKMRLNKRIGGTLRTCSK